MTKRLHLVKDWRNTTPNCEKCGLLLLLSDDIEKTPFVTLDSDDWLQSSFNCANVSAPVGKPYPVTTTHLKSRG